MYSSRKTNTRLGIPLMVEFQWMLCQINGLKLWLSYRSCKNLPQACMSKNMMILNTCTDTHMYVQEIYCNQNDVHIDENKHMYAYICTNTCIYKPIYVWTCTNVKNTLFSTRTSTKKTCMCACIIECMCRYVIFTYDKICKDRSIKHPCLNTSLTPHASGLLLGRANNLVNLAVGHGLFSTSKSQSHASKTTLSCWGFVTA